MSAVQSTGTGSRDTNTATLIITKPASVAVGDVLVAVMGWQNGTSRSLSTLSGWTLLQNSGSAVVGLAAFWKVADSGDVSASNYTWSFSGNTLYASGAILRINGTPVGSEIAASEIDVTTGNSTSFSFTTAVTPQTVTSLVISAFLANPTIGGVINVDSYTSNPSITFTERADLPWTGALVFGIASGAHSGITQITQRTFTTSGNVNADILSVIVVLNDPQNASGTSALLSADADFFAPAGSAGTTGTTVLLSADADLFDVDGRGDVMPVWRNVDKPAVSDVTNVPKS